MKTRIELGVVAMMLLSLGPGFAAERGADAYKVCAACHGFRGEGNRQVDAPALAGLETWYVERQLRHYRDGVRGVHPNDAPGATMATMALAVSTDAAIADVAAYIQRLAVRPRTATVDGDAARGKGLYQTCAACHGGQGEGNVALNAPGLAVMSDWYQVRQLENFKSGVRGAHPEDTYGQQMAPMAAMLEPQAMADIAAYVGTFTLLE